MNLAELSSEDFAALGAPNLVYVRAIKAAEIMADTPVETIRGFDLKPEQTLYAVHRADGARLAWLHEHGEVLARTEQDDGIHVRVRMLPANRSRFEREA